MLLLRFLLQAVKMYWKLLIAMKSGKMQYHLVPPLQHVGGDSSNVFISLFSLVCSSIDFSHGKGGGPWWNS